MNNSKKLGFSFFGQKVKNGHKLQKIKVNKIRDLIVGEDVKDLKRRNGLPRPTTSSLGVCVWAPRYLPSFEYYPIFPF
jgi:hypothetical protein